MWLIVCCFQRKQTSRTLDGLVLEGEELDFPKILCCWNRKWKNPQLHLFFIHGSRPSLGDAAAWIIYSHIIPHSLVKLYYQNPLFLLCPPPAPPPAIFLMPDIKLHGLAFEAQYSSFWASVWFLLIGIICSSFFPSLLFKTSKRIMHSCWHFKKKCIPALCKVEPAPLVWLGVVVSRIPAVWWQWVWAVSLESQASLLCVWL